jgi:hypothetical protein
MKCYRGLSLACTPDVLEIFYGISNGWRAILFGLAGTEGGISPTTCLPMVFVAVASCAVIITSTEFTMRVLCQMRAKLCDGESAASRTCSGRL